MNIDNQIQNHNHNIDNLNNQSKLTHTKEKLSLPRLEFIMLTWIHVTLSGGWGLINFIYPIFITLLILLYFILGGHFAIYFYENVVIFQDFQNNTIIDLQIKSRGKGHAM